MARDNVQPPIISPEGAGGFSSEFIEQALPVFGRNGLWLLISIIHYGWRAHADIAHMLVGARPADDAPDAAWHAFEHRSLAALEEVFMLVDQLYRLIHGIRAHLDGSDFLQAYCEHVPNMHRAYEELSRLDAAEWAEVLPLPDRGALVDCLAGMGVDDEVAADILELALELHGLCVKNMHEIAVFFERVPSPVGGISNCSLRDMNNDYRHGTRMLYRDCDPVPMGDIVTNPTEKAGMLLPADEVGPDAWHETVDVLVKPPDEDGRAHTVKTRFSAQWCESLILASANLGMLMRRLAAGFLRAQVDGRPGCAALAPFEWVPLEASTSEADKA